MTRRQLELLLKEHGRFCDWCGAGVSTLNAQVVDRPAGPLPLCGTCLHRYNNPDQYPYVRKALARAGK